MELRDGSAPRRDGSVPHCAHAERPLPCRTERARGCVGPARGIPEPARRITEHHGAITERHRGGTRRLPAERLRAPSRGAGQLHEAARHAWVILVRFF